MSRRERNGSGMFATTRQLLAVAPFGLLLLAGRTEAQDSLTGDKQALASAQAYVGTWRGVGQPKRGSNQGAWTEESRWAWRFHGGRAALRAQLTGNKYFVCCSGCRDYFLEDPAAVLAEYRQRKAAEQAERKK
jgi:YHS domain-containing protein